MNKHYHIPIDNTTNTSEEILSQNENSPNATKELSCYWAERKLQREHKKKNCCLHSPLDSTLNLREISLNGQDNGNYCYTCDL